MKTINTKRIIALCLSSIMLGSMFAGCTPKKDETVSSVPKSNAESTSSEKTNGKLIAEPLTLTYLFPENAYAPISQDCIALKEIKEKTNVSLEFQLVPGSDYDTKKNSYLATNKIPDLLYCSSGDIKTHGRNDMFLNLSKYEEYMPNYLALLNAEDRKNDSKSLYLDGNLYSFVRLEQYRVGTAPQPMIRMDLLEKNNIAIPKTWDELYNVFLQLKKLYPDTYIMATRNGTNYLIGQIAYALGSGGFEGFASSDGIYFDKDTDKYIYGPIQENFKTVLTFLNKMYKDKLLDPDYAVMTRDITWEKLSSGKLLFYYDNDTFAARTFNPALKQIDPDARFDMLDPMENSFGQTRALRYQRDWYADNTVINSEIKRPEDAVKFFDWLYSEEGSKITNFGVEGKSYVMENGEPTIVPELLEKHKSSSDVLASIQAEIGVGQFNFTPFINEQWFKQTADKLMVEHGDRIDKLTQDGKINFMKNPMTLAFSKDDADKLASLQTNVITVFNSEIDKFITGVRPISEYDSLIKAMNEQGAQTIEDMYNKAYNSVK